MFSTETKVSETNKIVSSIDELRRLISNENITPSSSNFRQSQLYSISTDKMYESSEFELVLNELLQSLTFLLMKYQSIETPYDFESIQNHLMNRAKESG